MTAPALAIVALISGRGTNLQAILDAADGGEIPAVVRAVISNEADAYGLERAREAGVATHVVPHRRYPTRRDFEAALLGVIEPYEPGLIVLAGFMRRLTEAFVARYPDRIMNIHPSLLPKYPGLDTHRRALQAGEREHGATVHFVTGELDAGPIIVQARVPVEPGDDERSLAERVLRQEHRIYPQAIAWFAQGRLSVAQGVAHLDGAPCAGAGR